MAYPLPRWIAHRGGGALAPENTLAGFRLAARMGYRAAEFDVMLTADGVPVVIHDETLERTTTGRGRVADLEWKTIAGADAGVRFHKAWMGEKVPRLEEVLALCAALDLGINVEIKPAAGHDEMTGRIVAETVKRLWPSDRPLLLSSFSPAALVAARDAVPGLPRALLVEHIPADWAERLQALACVALHARADDLLPNVVAEVRAAGVPLAAYTVNSAGLAEQCFGMGLAALFTDRLDCLGPL